MHWIRKTVLMVRISIIFNTTVHLGDPHATTYMYNKVDRHLFYPSDLDISEGE
jgi:hypothetical protein